MIFSFYLFHVYPDGIRKKSKKQEIRCIDIPLKHDRIKGVNEYKSRQRGIQMRRKVFIIVLMMAFIAVFVSGCKKDVGTPEDNAVVEETEDETDEQEQNRLFGYSCPNLSEPFYTVLKDSIGTALEEQGDRILVRDAGMDAGTQEADIQMMIDEGVSAVFLCPVDPEQITVSLEALKEADIPVINLDIRVKEMDLTEAFIGSDDGNAGKLCGENLAERKPEGGKLVIVEKPENAAINARITGFEEAVLNKRFEVVERIDAGHADGDLQSEFQKVLQENDQIDAVMCGDDAMALEVLSCLDEAGRNNILVYSVGGSPEIKTALADTESPMEGVGAQSPINIGKMAVKTVNAMLDGGAYEKETSIETFFINGENVEMYGTDGWQ